MAVCLGEDETGAATVVHPAAAVSWTVSILVTGDLVNGWDWARRGQPCAMKG